MGVLGWRSPPSILTGKIFSINRLIGYHTDLLEVVLGEHLDCEEMRKKLGAEIKRSVRTAGRHLFPIHCPQQDEHPDGHWALLSLETSKDEAVVNVRYFDTLDTANEVCLSRANKLLRMCEVDAKVERTNIFRQSGDDCTWWVLHYAEVEARLQHDEGLGACLSIGHALRKQQLRHCLKLASEQLGAARDTWLQDEQKQMAQAEAVRSMLREKVRDLVIFMKHQIHMSLKLKPGKQDYADFETRKGRHERNLGRLTGGGTSLRTRGSLRGG